MALGIIPCHSLIYNKSTVMFVCVCAHYLLPSELINGFSWTSAETEYAMRSKPWRWWWYTEIENNNTCKTEKLHLESVYYNGVHHSPSDHGLLGCDAIHHYWWIPMCQEDHAASIFKIKGSWVLNMVRYIGRSQRRVPGQKEVDACLGQRE